MIEIFCIMSEAGWLLFGSVVYQVAGLDMLQLVVKKVKNVEQVFVAVLVSWNTHCSRLAKQKNQSENSYFKTNCCSKKFFQLSEIFIETKTATLKFSNYYVRWTAKRK